MKRKKEFLLFCLLGIFGFSYLFIPRILHKGVPSEKIQAVKYDYGPYFFPIPISKFTRANLPCISIQVGNQIVSAVLDLGFRGELEFSSEFLEQIEQKKYLGMQEMYGVLGSEYKETLYEIPGIQIGPMSFSHPILHESGERFNQDSTLMREGNQLSTPEPGKIGWELFGNTNLFLDLGNSKIAFCDSIETLNNQGYAFAKFTKVPLLLGRGLIELEVKIGEKSLHCMLDTGATCNVLNTDLAEGTSMEQAMQNPATILRCSSFQIGGKDFGPINFYRIPIKIPIHIEAILGMEFFHDHLVFLDFSEKYAYFAKSFAKGSNR